LDLRKQDKQLKSAAQEKDEIVTKY